MAKKTILLIPLAVALGCNPGAPASDATTSSLTADSPLEGAWTVAAITNYPAPQPGYLLFAGRYYSLVRINLEYPRPALEPFDSATVDGLRAVWGPFTAHAGTYAMAGTTLTFTPLVAKNPDVMAPGNQIR